MLQQLYQLLSSNRMHGACCYGQAKHSIFAMETMCQTVEWIRDDRLWCGMNREVEEQQENNIKYYTNVRYFFFFQISEEICQQSFERIFSLHIQLNSMMVYRYSERFFFSCYTHIAIYHQQCRRVSTGRIGTTATESIQFSCPYAAIEFESWLFASCVFAMMEYFHRMLSPAIH